MSPQTEINQGFGDRLAALLESYGKKTREEVASQLDVHPNTVDNCMKGRVPRWYILVKISEYYGVSIDWLLTGKGEGAQLSKNEPPTPTCEIVNPYDLTPEDMDRYVKVNRYDVEASAGHGALVLDEQAVDQLTFKRDWVIGSKGWEPSNLMLMFVRGDSMEPTLYGGDLILVNTVDKAVHGGGLYVVRFDDALMAKRLYRTGTDTVQVISDNKEVYPPFEATLHDGLAIIGEIVWFCRELR